jgi:phosphate starvation-inducible PhoH-like protein
MARPPCGTSGATPSVNVSEHTIPLRSHEEAILVLGPYDRYAKLLRSNLGLEIFAKSGNLRLAGDDAAVELARTRIEHLLGKHRKGRQLESREIEDILVGPGLGGGTGAPRSSAPRASSPGSGGPSSERRAPGRDEEKSPVSLRRVAPREQETVVRSLRPVAVEPRSQNQRRYLEAIDRNALSFGIGAAGSGKTFLAVAAAVRLLREGRARRLIVSRPVVEAGERLGFLPGDLQAKLDPYMRPVYDALYDVLSFEDVGRLDEAGVLEIAPLAYMRGRTLSNAIVILDEAQNTTIGQMKMFLTRLGENSRMIVTGDPSQTDLEGQRSGLADAVRRLRGFAGVAAVEFSARDIVRHPLVEQIVRAYEGPGQRDEEGEPARPANGS